MFSEIELTGGYEAENSFVLCYREVDIYMWIAPSRFQDQLCMRAETGVANVRVVIARGTINPERLHFVDLLYLARETIPVMVHRIFAWPYAEAQLSDFYGAQVWIEGEPTNFGCVEAAFVSRRTLH